LVRVGIRGTLFLILGVASLGCMQGFPQGGPQGEQQGPGGRPQRRGLSPFQELDLGRKAYKEILSKAGNRVLPQSDPRVKRVREIGNRILEQAMKNRLLLREIHLDLEGYPFEPAFNVIEDNQVNAFCLPSCKVGVFTGLFKVADTDDQLAVVLGHEIAHALAHHASERVALADMTDAALAVVADSQKGMQVLDPKLQEQLIGLLSGADVRARSYDRMQEAEADHIGVFLMKFAGYDAKQAVVFWQEMEELSRGRRQPPEILATHPTNVQRIRNIQGWLPYAEGAYAAWKSGNVVK